MTIKELIKQLQEVEDDDMIVMCYDEMNLVELYDVEIHDMVLRKHVKEYLVVS